MEDEAATRRPALVRGILIPLLLLFYGTLCIVEQSGLLVTHPIPTTWDVYPVLGDTAVALGISGIAAGAFLHFHFFWRRNPGLWRIALVPEVLSLLAWLASFSCVIYRVLAGK